MKTERLALCLLTIGLALACTPERDRDGDGYSDNGYGPVDCAPDDPSRYPGAPERCNGVDDDCDGEIDEEGMRLFVDRDGDGAGAGSGVIVCEPDPPDGYSVLGGDCDDGNAQIGPGAVERCNGIDDNCDGAIDVPQASLDRLDPDGDGFPTRSVELCIDATLATRPADCGPNDPRIYPGASTADCHVANADIDCDGTLDCTDLAPPILELVATLPADGPPTRFAATSVGAFVLVGDLDPTLHHVTGPFEGLPDVGGRGLSGRVGAFAAGGDWAVWTQDTDLGRVLAAGDALWLDDDGPAPVRTFIDGEPGRVAVGLTDEGVVVLADVDDEQLVLRPPTWELTSRDPVEDWGIGVDLGGSSVLMERDLFCIVTPLALLGVATIDDSTLYDCEYEPTIAIGGGDDGLLTWSDDASAAHLWLPDPDAAGLPVLTPSRAYAANEAVGALTPVPGSTVRAFVLAEDDQRVFVNAHGALYGLEVPAAVPPGAVWTYLPANSHTLIARSPTNGAAWIFRVDGP